MWVSIIAIGILIFFFGGLIHFWARIRQLDAAQKFMFNEIDLAYQRDRELIDAGDYGNINSKSIDVSHFFNQLDKSMPWDYNFSRMLKVT